MLNKSAHLSIVSISLGVATLVSDLSMSPQELVKQADTALYRAKDKGRNRVVVFHYTMSMEKQAIVASIDCKSTQPVCGLVMLPGHAGIGEKA